MGAVLDWLGTPEASGLASRRLRIAGFACSEDLASDVVSEARVAVLKRARSTTPFEVDNAAAYGTTVVANAVKAMTRGATIYLEDIGDEPVSIDTYPLEDGFSDEFRLLVERSHMHEWLRSALLAYFCLATCSDAIPPEAPAPRSGSRPDQALAWPALWYAGQRDLFPTDGADPNRRTRGRRIATVIDRLSDLVTRTRTPQDHRHG